MWSLYEFIWDRAINGFLKDLRLSAGDFPAARVFYWRPYWNLAAVKQCARKLPGFVESEFDRDIGARPRDAGDDLRTATNFWNILRALPVVVSAAGAMKEQEVRDRELLSSDWPRRFEADLRLMDDDGLLRDFKQLVEGAYRVVEENYFPHHLLRVAREAGFQGGDGRPARLVSGLGERAGQLEPLRMCASPLGLGEPGPLRVSSGVG